MYMRAASNKQKNFLYGEAPMVTERVFYHT